MKNLKKISDEGFISRFFTNISKSKEVSVSVRYNGKKMQGTMFFSARRGNEPSLRIYDSSINLLVGETIQITFHNSEVIFLFKSEVTSAFKNTYTINKPAILFSSFRRLMSRHRISEKEDIYMEFANEKRKYRVFDISTTGLAFISENKGFDKERIYKNITIVINDEIKIFFDGLIKHIRVATNGEHIYGMRFSNMELASQNMLFLCTFRKIYPRLVLLGEALTKDILNLYEKSHYFKCTYKDSQYILSCADIYIKGFQEISENSTITSGLVFYKNDRPLAMSSVLRIYNRTFIGHQIISLPETKLDTNPIKEVQTALCDFLINHSSFEYYISYIILDFQSLLDYYIGFEGIINDNNKFKVDTLQCIECNCEEYTTFSETGDFECILLENTEEFIEFCKSNLSQIEFMSYSYNATQVQLTEIKQIYNALELFADRRIWCIKNAGKVVAYAVAECYTDGINLFNSLDILRVYSTTDVFDINNIFEALIPQAIIFYKDNNKNVFFIHLDDEQVGAKDINIPGLNYRYPVGRIISNKEGVIEYKKFLNGELISIPGQYKLTHPQLAIWYTEKVYPGTSFGNIAEVVIIKDELDFTSLERAINQVIHNNSGLRLRFTEEDGEPRQYVVKYNYLNIEFYDFSQIGGFDGLYNWDEYKNGTCFKLIDSDLYYFAIFKIDNENCGFYIKTHHLVSDAWTIANLLISKIVEYYGLLKNNEKPSRKLMPSYIDFILREEEYKNSEDFHENMKFWKDKFKTVPEVMSIKPLASPFKDMKAKRKTFTISEEFTSQILEYSKLSGNSPFTVFLSILLISINKLTSKNDIVLGIPVLNRSNKREKETVGMFISIVPMRINIEDEMPFEKFIKYVNYEWMQVLKNQKHPYDLILSDFRDTHKINDNLYDIVLSFQNAKHEKTEVDYSTEWVFTGQQTDSLVVHISDRDDKGCFKFDFDYLINVLNDVEIEQMYQHIINLLKSSVYNPSMNLNKLELLSENEKHKILFEFNNTMVEYPQEKTMHELFEIQASITPQNIAVVFDEEQLTYQELNEKSNQLARILKEKCVEPDTIVGIMIERSLEMVICILAVLKAGGAYLPLDPEYPFERLKFMLEDSKAKLLITKTGLFNSELSINNVIYIDNCILSDKEKTNLININKSSNLAYLIYTSGSTGKPKGVMLEHKGMANLKVFFSESLCISENDNIIQFASSSFDASIWEIFMSLFKGATLYIPTKDIINDFTLFEDYLNENSITIATLPPTYLAHLNPNRIKTLKKLITAGSAISNELFNRWKNKVEYINAYGPTESTICATIWESKGLSVLNNSIPIGKPIMNTRIYIVDKNNNLVPIGVEGELCISGDMLARGYIFRPDMTEEKFVNNLLLNNQRMYKTGDLAKWLPDGNIEFLGRIDHQVKIRGFRVELGEIENSLLKHKSIIEAVVIDKNINGSVSLCAYIVTGNEISNADLRAFLSNDLPDFMIPSYFIKLNKLPLTQSGKVDRKALPNPKDDNIKTDYISPTNDFEKELVRIWEQVLGVERIGICDDFFELGGDSLAIIRVMTLIFPNNWDITIQDFYKYKTIKNLFEKITGATELAISTENLILDKVERNKENIVNNTTIFNEKKQFKKVLITGATGFLGMHILDQLLIEPQTVVYCLVRGDNELNSTEKLKDLMFFYFKNKYTSLINERLFVINGDITLKNFGLSESNYNNIGQKIDIVFHSAALVKHYGNYAEFEKTNVFGTENVIEFSIKFNTKFCHISTMSVSGTIDENKFNNITFTENDFYIGQNYINNVYVKSKFEAENIVFKAVKNGLNASVFRVGNLTGRYDDGRFQENIKENSFYQVLKSIVELGFIYDEMLEHVFEFTPIDFCSKAIVEIMKENYSSGKVFHIFNHNFIKISDFLNILKTLKINIKIYNNEIFKKHFDEISKEKNKYKAVEGLINYFNVEKTIGNKKLVKCSSDITLEHLRQMNFYWPEINSLYLEKILNYMRIVGFLVID
jgi:amino acid adenylation domain-containing protein/thioester reductase-like protein